MTNLFKIQTLYFPITAYEHEGEIDLIISAYEYEGEINQIISAYEYEGEINQIISAYEYEGEMMQIITAEYDSEIILLYVTHCYSSPAECDSLLLISCRILASTLSSLEVLSPSLLTASL